MVKLKTALLLTVVCGLFLTACDPQPPEPKKPPEPEQPKQPAPIRTQESISWESIPGWQQDKTHEAWPALLNNCTAMLKKTAEKAWHPICERAATLTNPPDEATSKQFFQQHFQPFRLYGENGKQEGFMTGYYEPLLYGSHEADERFKYPLYAPPKDMLIIDLAELYPELEGKRIRGRVVEGNRVIPYYDRADIESPERPLKGQEIIWVDNRDDVFFLHIQGSGRIQLPDGKIIGAGYANQNGHKYISIGKRLIESNEVERKHMNLFTLKQWLRENPDKAEKLLNENPSYVFFNLRENVEAGPIGSLNVPLIAERSIAIDPKKVSLGSLMFVDSHYPDEQPLQKLVFAQDTGGAIKGDLRADFFYGAGKQAEQHAGRMKQSTRFYLLEPKTGIDHATQSINTP